jgi:hypothetical protein
MSCALNKNMLISCALCIMKTTWRCTSCFPGERSGRFWVIFWVMSWGLDVPNWSPLKESNPGDFTGLCPGRVCAHSHRGAASEAAWPGQSPGGIWKEPGSWCESCWGHWVVRCGWTVNHWGQWHSPRPADSGASQSLAVICEQPKGACGGPCTHTAGLTMFSYTHAGVSEMDNPGDMVCERDSSWREHGFSFK